MWHVIPVKQMLITEIHYSSLVRDLYDRVSESVICMIPTAEASRGFLAKERDTFVLIQVLGFFACLQGHMGFEH